MTTTIMFGVVNVMQLRHCCHQYSHMGWGIIVVVITVVTSVVAIAMNAVCTTITWPVGH